MLEMFSSILIIVCIFFINFFFISSLSPAYSEIKFEEVSQYAGINRNVSSYGSSWGDFNGDGWPDLYTGDHGKAFTFDAPKLFLNNRNGTFTDFSLQSNLISVKPFDLHTAAWADFDNDGDQDLLIVVGAQRGEGIGPNVLLVNTDGIFVDNATSIGLDYPLGRGRMPVWFDFNNDGQLDVLLANAARPDLQAPTAIFQKNGAKYEIIATFDEMEKSSTIQISDLFLEGTPKLIFINWATEGIYSIGKLPLENELASIDIKKIRSVDTVIADFNGDLLPDLFRSIGSNRLFSEFGLLEFNTGTGFEHQTELDSKFSSCHGAVGGDFDNDMDVDIFMVCSILGIVEEEGADRTNVQLPNILYENLGNGTFILVKDAGGAEGGTVGASDTVTIADYDLDGFLDLFVTNGGGPGDTHQKGPHQLFRNMGNSNHWIEIDLVGTVSNKDGIGAKVLVKIDNFTQMREQTGGMHYNGQNYQRLHFGLGENEMVNKIIIYWPSGIIHSINDVNVDQVLRIVELSEPISPKKQLSLQVEPSKIMCKNNLILIQKYHNLSAACVNSSTAIELEKRGWGKLTDSN